MMMIPHRRTEPRPVRVRDLTPLFERDEWDEWLRWLSPSNGQPEYSRYLRARRRRTTKRRTKD